MGRQEMELDEVTKDPSVNTDNLVGGVPTTKERVRGRCFSLFWPKYSRVTWLGVRLRLRRETRGGSLILAIHCHSS